jgi:Domain of unknown function (DUF5122) beta-propeller
MRHGGIKTGANVSAVVLLVLFCFTSRPLAAPGDLDPAFGSGGKVTTDFKGFGGAANAIALQTDRKVVVAGIALTGDVFRAQDFGLARYNPDGSPDTTFGAGAVRVSIIHNGASNSAPVLIN